MSFNIVHLTDFHFTKKTDISKKIEPLCKAILSRILNSDILYILTSGDIAFSGIEAEYTVAAKFYSVLKSLLKAQRPDLKLHFLFVPGNHDCDFNLSSQIRRNEVSRLSYNSLGEDNSVINECLKVQEQFWHFYSKYNKLPEDKLFYTISHSNNNQIINFHCLNSSWVSTYGEQPGALFFPVQKYDAIKIQEEHLNICVWHHPYNWFDPKTVENNKNEFQNFTDKLGKLNFEGHEHQQGHLNIENLNTSKKIHLFSGEIFHSDKKPNKSGFQILIFDNIVRKGNLHRFQFDGEIYACLSEYAVEVEMGYKVFKVKREFLDEMETLKIPLILENKKEVKLSEIFVYPDMEVEGIEYKNFETFYSTFKIFEDINKKFIISSLEQLGKTSLLYKLFMGFYEKGKIPIYLNAKELKDVNVLKYINRNFKSQYSNGEKDYEKFLQLKTEERVLLLDDYHEIEFNMEGTNKIFEAINSFFGTVVLIIDSSSSYLTNIRREFKEYKFYNLKPLGFKKRNDLISNYHSLKADTFKLNSSELMKEIKDSFDKIQSILGDKLMPSNPVYILSILQALEYNPIQQNETSFGYCYQTLIHYSLSKAGIKNTEIDSYINFLTELSFFLKDKEDEFYSEKELSDFYKDYESKFLIDGYKTLITNLKKSKILIERDNEYSIGYKYILYFLAAKKISEVINTIEGKNIIEKLFATLHIEKNANILIFITHHTKDVSFIEQSLFKSMTILENYTPISLEKTDEYYTKLNDIANEIAGDVLEINRNPLEERSKYLEKQDKLENNKTSNHSVNYKDVADEFVIPFYQAARVIEILGQIIKNRKGSLPKNELTGMIKEVYTTAFRTLSYQSELLDNGKKEIIELIASDVKLHSSRNDIELKINKFIQQHNFKTCLGIFSKILHSAGLRELKDIYNNIAQEIDNPASHLLSFSINSYHGTVTINELKKIADLLKDNQVALKILRARMKSYVYQNDVTFKDKQAFASILNMKLLDTAPKKN